jgi:hypothetical protein
MDPVMWPAEVVKFAIAIEFAEGSLRAHPDWNNPGDLTYSFGLSNRGPQNKAGVLAFNSIEDGWHALFHQCWIMLSGRSKEYSLSDTLDFAGRKYSGGDPNWVKNVASALGVSAMTTLRQLAGITTV